MKRYLLDTNVISELRKIKPHGGVVSWLSALQDENVFLSAVSLGELQRGVERTRRLDPKKAEEIEEWVEYLSTSIQLLPMDGPCFREWARLMQGKPEDLLEDAMIAATARIHGLTVATRNQRDFVQLGVDTLNPFQPRP